MILVNLLVIGTFGFVLLLLVCLIVTPILVWDHFRRKRAQELRYLRGQYVRNPWDNGW